MPIATISVNFASSGEIYSAGTLTAVKSINPNALKGALTTGSSFAWTPFINSLHLAGGLGVKNQNPLKPIHVGTGISTPVTSTTNAILANTTGAGAVAAFIARNDTNVVEATLTVNSTNAYVGTASNHVLQLGSNNNPVLHINSSGQVGIGAAPSAALLHITGNAPDIRLQSSVRSFEIQSNTTDLAGSFNIQDINAAASRLFINSAGNIGINTTSVSYRLDVNGTGRFQGVLNASSGTASSAYTNGALVVTGGVGISGSLYTNGGIWAASDITAYYSDARLKTIKNNILNPLEKINTLNGVIYQPNEKAKELGFDTEQKVGLIAQEVQKVLPEAVKPAPFDLDEQGSSKSGENYLTIQYEKLIPLLVEAIKQLDAKVKALESKT